MKRYFSRCINCLLVVFAIPFVASAADVTITNPLKATTLQGLATDIATFIFNVALWIVPTMYIVAGFYYLTSQGEPEKVNTAKKVFLYTSIGLLIVVLAQGLLKLFTTIFVNTGTP